MIESHLLNNESQLYGVDVCQEIDKPNVIFVDMGECIKNHRKV